MRIHIGQLAAHCRAHLGLPVDAGRDFAIVWLGPRLQPRIVRRGAAATASSAAAAAPAATPPGPAASQPGAAARGARAPFALVAYRHGAVVLLGPPAHVPDAEFEMPDADAALLSRVMPLGVFYRTGLPEGPAETGEAPPARVWAWFGGREGSVKGPLSGGETAGRAVHAASWLTGLLPLQPVRAAGPQAPASRSPRRRTSRRSRSS